MLDSIYHISVRARPVASISASKLMNTLFAVNAILDSDLGVPLRGAAIGNGWIDSHTQYPSYLDYAVKHGIIEENSDVRRI